MKLMMLRGLRALSVALLFIGAASQAQAAVLTFQGLGPANSFIPQTYGDVAGYVDVSYRVLNGFGNSTQLSSLQYWPTGYASLVDVAWGGTNNPTQVGEIRFDGLNGQLVTLNAFSLAGWANTNWGTRTIQVLDGAYNVITSITTPITGTNVYTFTPNVESSTVILQWDYPYFVAADNVAYQATPEPASMAIWGFLGLAGAGGGWWKKRRNAGVIQLA